MPIEGKLISFVEGVRIRQEFESLYDFCNDINGYAWPIENYSFSEVVVDGKELFIFEDGWETPVGGIFEVVKREDRKVWVKFFGEISDGYFGGYRHNQDEEKQKIVEKYEEWWSESGHDQYKQLQAANPSFYPHFNPECYDYSQWDKQEEEEFEAEEEKGDDKNVVAIRARDVCKQVNPDYPVLVATGYFYASLVDHVARKVFAAMGQDATVDNLVEAVGKVFTGDLGSFIKGEICKNYIKYSTKKDWKETNFVFTQDEAIKLLEGYSINATPEFAVAYISMCETVIAEICEKTAALSRAFRMEIYCEAEIKLVIHDNPDLKELFKDMDLKVLRFPYDEITVVEDENEAEDDGEENEENQDNEEIKDEEIEKLEQIVANVTLDPSPSPAKAQPIKDSRAACYYGINCYRKNPDHFKMYTHPPEHRINQKATPQQDDKENAVPNVNA